jgi:hypothetical protein
MLRDKLNGSKYFGILERFTWLIILKRKLNMFCCSLLLKVEMKNKTFVGWFLIY